MSSFQVDKKELKMEKNSIRSGSVALVDTNVKQNKLYSQPCQTCGHRNPSIVNHCYACGAFLTSN